MILSPRYGSSPILAIDGAPSDPLVPIIRQHRRLAAVVDHLDEREWTTPSRCDGWTVRDVVAHLAGVNDFWGGSIRAGLAGRPTSILKGFDPASTPPLMVGAMAALSTGEVLEQFVRTSEAMLGVLAELDDEGWSTPAESPVGHVPISLLVQHALWDSWVHERDIALPLGTNVPAEGDEVAMCLRYAAAIGPVFGLELGHPAAGRFAVEAIGPSVRFVVDVGDTVGVDGAATIDGLPCLRGDAVELTEVLSLRAPMPIDMPEEWADLLGGLRTAFGGG